MAKPSAADRVFANTDVCLEICVSATNLPEKADFLTNADPTVVLFTRDMELSDDGAKWNYGPWREYARTEIIEDTATPVFATWFVLPYYKDRPQPLKFELYDWESISSENVALENQTLLGEYYTSVTTLVRTSGMRVRGVVRAPGSFDDPDAAAAAEAALNDGDGEPDEDEVGPRSDPNAPSIGLTTKKGIRRGQIGEEIKIISGPITDVKSLPHLNVAAYWTYDNPLVPEQWVRLAFQATDVRVSSSTKISQPDAFIEVYRDSDGAFDLVHRSEVQMDSHKPKWKPFAIPLSRLCMHMDMRMRIVLRVFDSRPRGFHKLLGTVVLPAEDLMKAAELGTVLDCKKYNHLESELNMHDKKRSPKKGVDGRPNTGPNIKCTMFRVFEFQGPIVPRQSMVTNEVAKANDAVPAIAEAADATAANAAATVAENAAAAERAKEAAEEANPAEKTKTRADRLMEMKKSISIPTPKQVGKTDTHIKMRTSIVLPKKVDSPFPEDKPMMKDVKFLWTVAGDRVSRTSPELGSMVRNCLWTLHETSQMNKSAQQVKEIREIARKRRLRARSALGYRPSSAAAGLLMDRTGSRQEGLGTVTPAAVPRPQSAMDGALAGEASEPALGAAAASWGVSASTSMVAVSSGLAGGHSHSLGLPPRPHSSMASTARRRYADIMAERAKDTTAISDQVIASRQGHKVRTRTARTAPQTGSGLAKMPAPFSPTPPRLAIRDRRSLQTQKEYLKTLFDPNNPLHQRVENINQRIITGVDQHAMYRILTHKGGTLDAAPRSAVKPPAEEPKTPKSNLPSPKDLKRTMRNMRRASVSYANPRLASASGLSESKSAAAVGL